MAVSYAKFTMFLSNVICGQSCHNCAVTSFLLSAVSTRDLVHQFTHKLQLV